MGSRGIEAELRKADRRRAHARVMRRGEWATMRRGAVRGAGRAMLWWVRRGERLSLMNAPREEAGLIGRQ